VVHSVSLIGCLINRVGGLRRESDTFLKCLDASYFRESPTAGDGLSRDICAEFGTNQNLKGAKMYEIHLRTDGNVTFRHRDGVKQWPACWTD
jgi:hypothetical protein